MPSPAPPPPTEPNPDSSAAGGGTQRRATFDPTRFQIVDGRLVKLTVKQRAKLAAQARMEARAKKRMREANRSIVTPAMQEQIGVLSAVGLSTSAIARAFKLNPSSVSEHLKSPELAAVVARHREMFRAQALEQAQAIQLKAWTRAHGALEADDAKAFDAYTRGIAAMERTAASASGENKPASVNVAVGVQTTLSADEKDELLREFRRTIEGEVVRG